MTTNRWTEPHGDERLLPPQVFTDGVRARVSPCGSLRYESGTAVWTDEVTTRQSVLHANAVQLMHRLADWATLVARGEEIHTRDSKTGDTRPAMSAQAFEELVARNIIVLEGSDRHETEEQLLRTFEGAPQARTFHLTTRTTRRQKFANLEAANRQAATRATVAPPPDLSAPADDVVCFDIAAESRALIEMTDPGFFEVLYRRRSIRSGPSVGLPLSTFADLLQVSTGATYVSRSGTYDDHFLRTSASGGARHPIDVYCYVSAVEGLTKGPYVFDAVRGALIRRPGELAEPDEIVAACGDQEYFSKAPLILVFVADVHREMWKYRNSRAYRVILADLGHIAQTVQLVATALGLRSVISCALRDESWEEMLGLDSRRHAVLGAMAIGTLTTIKPRGDNYG